MLLKSSFLLTIVTAFASLTSVQGQFGFVFDYVCGFLVRLFLFVSRVGMSVLEMTNNASIYPRMSIRFHVFSLFKIFCCRNNCFCLPPHPIINFSSLLQKGALPVAKDCSCSGGWGFDTGVNFNLACASDKICIPGFDVCATAGFDGKYYRRGKSSVTELEFDVADLFGDEFTNPDPITLKLTHASPLKIRNPVNFVDCDAMIGMQNCTSCDACNGGKGFQFNCSNLYSLPNFNVCIGLPA